MSNARSTRRSTINTASNVPDMSALTNLDRLILAQAVYELGANSWTAVAKLLSKHPLVSRHKSLFSPQVSFTSFSSFVLTHLSGTLVMSGDLYSPYERGEFRLVKLLIVLQSFI
jgi:hypothetical protein